MHLLVLLGVGVISGFAFAFGYGLAVATLGRLLQKLGL